MPGLTGIIRKVPGEGLEQDLEAMVAAMRHELHYRGSQYVDRDLGVYVGWTSRAGTYDDCMPLVCNGGDTIIVFQGENYSADGEQADTTAGPDHRRSRSAAQLIGLYEQCGDDFLKQLNGWFCGLIIDRRSRRVTLFNDRYGMSRVYCHENEEELLFSSEAKCLLKVRPQLRRINIEALAEYLRFNCVLGNRTLFSDVSLLPPASSWIFNGSRVPSRRRYFEPAEWEEQERLGQEEFFEAFSDAASRVVARYSEGAGNLGFSLTAGLDTRLILAALDPVEPNSAQCYTFGGAWGETFDMRAGLALAKIMEQPFSIIRTDERFLSQFGHYAEKSVYISDGTHDAFGAHDVYLNERAREIAGVRLTGKFGSEVVRIRKLIPACSYDSGFMQPELRRVFDALPAVDDISGYRHPLSKVVFEEIPWYEYGRVAIEQSQLVLRTPYMDNELVGLMFQAPDEVRSDGELQADYVKARSRRLGAITTNLGKLGAHRPVMSRLLYGPYWALFKAEYIYLYATPHWLTRLDRYLGALKPERRLSGKQKFEGYRIWIRTEFAEFIRDTLLGSRAGVGGVLNERVLATMVNRHIAGTHNYLNEINKALTIQLIHSTLLKA